MFYNILSFIALSLYENIEDISVFWRVVAALFV